MELWAIAAASAVPVCYLLYRWAQGGQFTKSHIRMDGQVVIITGANTGIGRETAIDLAKRGAKIYLACRDLKRASAARQEIIALTGSKLINILLLDLSSLDSVREFADEFKRKEKKLDVLINNAGVMGLPKRETTKNGLELQIGTNHFGHFLLTNLLLDLLKASESSRVINVSSVGHKFGKIHQDDLQMEKSYSKWAAYSQSKLANVLFTRELAKRLQGTNVTANSLHPGAVRTELGRHLGLLRFLLTPFHLFFKSAKAGAQTSIMLAVDPTLNNVTGKYFADCAVAQESKAARCDETAAWLWDISEKITKLK